MDITNPAEPREVAHLGLPAAAYGIKVSGNYTYVTGHGRLYVVDISNPARPFQAGSCPIRGYGRGIAVSGDFAYVAGADQGLTIVDVSNPIEPQEVSHYYTSGSAYGVAIFGEHIFVADGYSGLRVFDVSNPAEPQEVGYFETPGSAKNVTVGADGLVYVAETYSLGLYDCSEAMSAQADPATHVPTAFCLNPAFPNPFNSTTTISFDLPQASPISVRIFDLTGRPVATLVDGFLKTGQHTAVWNANGSASGSYLVRMEAADYRRAIPITLVK